MKLTNILIIGKNKAILDLLVRLLNEGDQSCYAIGFIDEQEALTVENFSDLDILLLSSGIDEIAEEKIRKNAMELNSKVKIIQHNGGGSGLLKNEIQEVLRELEK